MQRQLTDNFICSQTPGIQSSGCFTENVPSSRREEGDYQRDLLAAQRLEAASRLAAWVAHQINNPLGAISGNAQLLARRLQRDIGDQETLREYLKYIDGIQTQTERCARITGEMLNFTRPGEPDLRAVDVTELIRDVIAMIGYAHPECNVCWDDDERSDLPRACADPDWLLRILFELLSNAVQASKDGPVGLFARVATRESSGRSPRIEIEIWDSGSGIEEGDLPRIFDPFFSTRDKARGLGLTLGLEMAQKMGGDIRVAKSSGSGSVFITSIPIWGQRD